MKHFFKFVFNTNTPTSLDTLCLQRLLSADFAQPNIIKRIVNFILRSI